MGIQEVADIIEKITTGFVGACAQCLDSNSDVVVCAIHEQLYSGVDGNDEYLSPTYDDDPYFEEPGYWYHRAQDYKAWKKAITPPVKGPTLNIFARPDEVPNLYIDGKFYTSITATLQGDTLMIDSGSGNGPLIVEKYGDQILTLTDKAVQYFNEDFMLPAIDQFFKDCGYK